MTALEIARRYTAGGWSVIPIPFRSKKAVLPGWPALRLTDADLPAHFNGEPQNIGVLLGEPSGWRIDVDLDHPRAVELAPQYLPATSAIFGRPSKRRSHWLYHVTAPVATKKHKSKSAGMIVELRSTGTQTVFPGSVHETGESIEWEGSRHGVPAAVDPALLCEAVKCLANAVLVEVGERSKPTAPRLTNAGTSAARTSSQDQAARCVAAMRRMKMADHNDGSGRLHAAACRTVEHDLDDSTALSAIRAYAVERPFPRDWSDAEILQRVRDAEKEWREAGRCEDIGTRCGRGSTTTAPRSSSQQTSTTSTIRRSGR